MIQNTYFLARPHLIAGSFSAESFSGTRRARVWCSAGRQAQRKYIGNTPILECNQDSLYRLSAMPSIWQRDYFLKNIQNEWSPWEWETYGSEGAKHDNYKILGTGGDHVVYNTLSVRNGDLSRLDFRIVDDYDQSLDENVIEEMKDLKIL